MQAIKCEMCGSTEIVKEEGVYVCKSCGLKYSPEEAKKLQIEGTVIIDDSQELSNLYQVARRARNEHNNENAAKYYDMILIKEPTSWEASFYSAYCGVLSQSISADYITDSIRRCIVSTLDLIQKYIVETNEQIEAINEVSASCVTVSSALSVQVYKDFLEKTRNTVDVYAELDYVKSYFSIRDMLYTLGDQIDSSFGSIEELHDNVAEIWGLGVYLHSEAIKKSKRCVKMLSPIEENQKIILEYVTKIKKYKPSYDTSEVFGIGTSSGTTDKSSSGGCYVATAVYGSYDCPEVWTLRRWRDDTLAKTRSGRAFIRIYYAISPTLVKWFGNTDWFKKLWRPKLDRMVQKLNTEGVEDTPYNDPRY